MPQPNAPPRDSIEGLIAMSFFLEIIEGVFKKRPNFCYEEFIAHFTEF